MKAVTSNQLSLLGCLFEYSNEAIFVFNENFELEFKNQAAERFMNLVRVSEISDAIKSFFSPTKSRQLSLIHSDSKRAGLLSILNVTIPVRSDESHSSTFIELSLIQFVDNVQKTWFSTTMRDVSYQVRTEKKLRKLINADELTGVYNRRGFNQNFSEFLGLNVSTVILDLDFFKRINDEFGHNVGDDVLVDFSKHFLKNLARAQFVARLGGEEFVAVYVNITFSEILHDLQAAQVQFERHQNAAKFRPKVTFSAGVSNASPMQSMAALMKKADDNLYAAKRLGRNRIVFDTELNSEKEFVFSKSA